MLALFCCLSLNHGVWVADFDAMVFPQAMELDALLTSHPIEVEVREKDGSTARKMEIEAGS